jgi:hypothetical protein
MTVSISGDGPLAHELAQQFDALFFRPALLNDAFHFKVCNGAGELKAERFGNRLFVFEKLYFAAQVRLLLIQRQDSEAPLAARIDIEAAVLLAISELLNDHCTANARDAILHRQHDAELGSGGRGLANHFLVARLEYVEGDHVAGEYDESQGKERKQPVG